MNAENPRPLTPLVLLAAFILILSAGMKPVGHQNSPAGGAPVISKLTYDSITTSSVMVQWETDIPADSRILWMVSDSNYQPVVFTGSSYSAGQVTGHRIILDSLLPATVYRYRVLSANGSGTAADSGYFVTRSESSGSIEVYFNHTVDTTVSTGEKANGKVNFENLFDEQIGKAKHSIDITMWEFSQITSVASALIAAKDRGVKIRFIYDCAAYTPLIDTLLAHGIPVIKRNYDTAGFSMHDKFWIFDYRYNTNPADMYLWTGSTNVSHAMFHEDRNNIILIQDQSLCAVYTREFEEMWGSHTDLPDLSRAKFGPAKTDNTPHIVNVDGVRIEVYFAPTDSIADTICSIADTRVRKSLYFCMYKFVLPPVESALHLAYQNGARLSGVFDSSNSIRHGCAYPRMKGMAVAGAWNPAADVFIDTITGLLHHKYFLVDADSAGVEKIIGTGSFNWEIPAQQGNDENLLVIRDSRVNNLYFQEFCARYRESGGTLVGSPWGIPVAGSGRDRLHATCLPNPFSDRTTVRFRLERPARVTLELYDLTGRQVASLDEGDLAQGTHNVSLDGRSLPAGLLLCRIKAGTALQCLRLLHLSD